MPNFIATREERLELLVKHSVRITDQTDPPHSLFLAAAASSFVPLASSPLHHVLVLPLLVTILGSTEVCDRTHVRPNLLLGRKPQYPYKESTGW